MHAQKGVITEEKAFMDHNTQAHDLMHTVNLIYVLMTSAKADSSPISKGFSKADDILLLCRISSRGLLDPNCYFLLFQWKGPACSPQDFVMLIIYERESKKKKYVVDQNDSDTSYFAAYFLGSLMQCISSV